MPSQLSSTSLAQSSSVGVRDTTSAGHCAAVPSHTSAGSHAATVLDARHTVPAAASTSAGHTALVPVHRSATSQAPTAARHATVDAANPSAGHSPAVPSHTSATSHAPAAARHIVPAGRGLKRVAPDMPAGATHTSQARMGLAAPSAAHCPSTRQKPSSVRPSQSLSAPSQVSVASGLTPIAPSLQSARAPIGAHAAGRNPSPSRSTQAVTPPVKLRARTSPGPVAKAVCVIAGNCTTTGSVVPPRPT